MGASRGKRGLTKYFLFLMSKRGHRIAVSVVIILKLLQVLLYEAFQWKM